MKKISLSFLLLFWGLFGYGQINMEDSSVQVITYWDKGDVTSYSITLHKTNIVGEDTTLFETTTYDVDITVLKATDKTYIVQWHYKNMSTNNDNPTVQKLMNMTKNMKVIYKTNELGIFLEVVNWKDIKKYIQKAIQSLGKDMASNPELNKALSQMQATYSTKEAIESVAIKDIQQFHTFHGAKYLLGEVVEGQLQLPNIYGTGAIDADFLAYLDEINEEENNYIMRATQEANKEQLSIAAFEYLTKMSKHLNVPPPQREDINDLTNITETGSRIHGSGWVIYSIQTVTITSENVTHVEERIIEIK
jgi:hypothetical protein